jgi:putative NADH-flavin reductase
MSTNVAKPAKVAIIGASGTYGKGILARAEEISVEAVVVTAMASSRRSATTGTSVRRRTTSRTSGTP